MHATLADVLYTFAIPTRPKYNPTLFSARIKELIGRFDARRQPGGNIMTNEKLYAVVQTLEQGMHGVQTSLQQLEHGWHLPVAYLVIPIIALGDTLTHPVMLGVMLGLLLIKFIGITGACWLALRLGIGQLPSSTRFSQIAAVSVLGGIGFTMSIFIAELAFAAQRMNIC